MASNKSTGKVSCHYREDGFDVYIADPYSRWQPLRIAYVSEFNIEEENEVSETPTFDGVVVDSYKYPKTTISFTRLIRFNAKTEKEIDHRLYCAKSEPVELRFIAKKTTPDFDGNIKETVGQYNATYVNCRVSSNKKNFKPDEEFKQELEFKSEGLKGTIRGRNEESTRYDDLNVWKWADLK